MQQIIRKQILKTSKESVNTMFNAEQLLGKLMAEMVGSDHGHKKSKSHKKNKGSGAMHSLTSTLLSGKGVMTAIGFGVGAYEILKSRQGASPPSLPSLPVTPDLHAGNNRPFAADQASVPPPLPPVPNNPVNSQQDKSGHSEDLALRLIQVMIAAAHADGSMDRDEEKKILDKLQGQGINKEERLYILAEMHDPKSIEHLVAGITDPRLAQTIYSLAVATVIVDTIEERAWLDRLATALSISKEMCRFIEAED